MSSDLFLLDQAVRQRSTVPVLRLYSWSQPTLSIGANQHLDRDLSRRCADQGIDIVRRPTGGSAVLHGADLTYCVVAPYSGMTVLEAYRWVAAGLIAGLARLGLEAEVVRHQPALPTATDARVAQGAYGPAEACFAKPVGADLEINGRKICGSAQKRRRGWFLQHGSIPISDDRPVTGRLLRLERVALDWTCIQELRPGTSSQELSAALVTGFTSCWGPVEQISDRQVFGGGFKGKASAKVVCS